MNRLQAINLIQLQFNIYCNKTESKLWSYRHCQIVVVVVVVVHSHHIHYVFPVRKSIAQTQEPNFTSSLQALQSLQTKWHYKWMNRHLNAICNSYKYITFVSCVFFFFFSYFSLFKCIYIGWRFVHNYSLHFFPRKIHVQFVLNSFVVMRIDQFFFSSSSSLYICGSIPVDYGAMHSLHILYERALFAREKKTKNYDYDSG